MKTVALAIVALAGCKDTDIVIGGLHEVAALRAIPNRDLDILFVVDNSASMADDQAALADNFPRMMDVLGEIDGGLPNLHIGVISSDMGTSGGPMIGVPIAECSGFGDDGALHAADGMTAKFLSDIDDGQGGRTRNYDGALRDAFASNALLGETGCGFEQHLASMVASFSNPANAGFIRASANLAVVILADEDDCSANADLFGPESPELGPLQSFRCFAKGVSCDGDTVAVGPKQSCVPRSSAYMEDVQPYVAALAAQKPDARMIMTAGIVGPTDAIEVVLQSPPGGGEPQLALGHACVSPTGAATDPAVRIGAFLEAFAPRSSNTSICQSDFSQPLVTIGETAKRLVGDPCIDTSDLADTDPGTSGVQPACEVIDIRDGEPLAPSYLPACNNGSSDCFELVVDPIACPRSADHLKLRVLRSEPVPDDTWTHVQCQVD